MTRTIVAFTVLALAGTPAAAQVSGLPVYNAGVTNGIGFALDAGVPNDRAGGGWAAGLTGKAGFGPLGVTATMARHDREFDEIWSGGATANLKVFGGPLIPLSVTLQGGAGYTSFDSLCIPEDPDCSIDQWRFPVGAGIAFTIPNPALAIKPWIAPRMEITRLGGETVADPAVSAGVEFNFITGLGLHAAYDLVFADGGRPGIFGAGLHYTFRVPGL